MVRFPLVVSDRGIVGSAAPRALPCGIVPEVVVDGVRLAYDVRGEGPPVLLVCGTGMPAAMWQVLIAPHLSEAGYQVITFDNRGIAPSDIPPPPYTVEEMAADTAGLLDHLGVGPVAALGASLGGTIVQHLALTRPDLVGAAVFMVGLGRVSVLGRTMIEAMEAFLRLPDPRPPEILTALMATALVAPPRWGDDDAVAAAVQIGSLLLPSDPAGLLGQYTANLAWAERDRLDDLAGLAMPALAIAAEHDIIFPPSQVRAAVARMPDARYVELPGAPHTPIDPAHDATIKEAVLSFLHEHHPAP
jgi:pimeloyl-ACP methyl ester carboxylesterase